MFFVFTGIWYNKMDKGGCHMRIALVDDDPQDLKYLKNEISRWAGEHHIPLAPAPCTYQSSEAFLGEFHKNLYDIIFLDIYMPGINGMDTARKIRETDQGCRLIFTTTSFEFAAESYEVDSSYYLVKPYSYEKLALALSRCGTALLEQGQMLVVPGKDGEEPLLLHTISYAECVKRRIIVHKKDGSEQTVFMNLRDFSACLLQFPYFCDCTRGILVNLEAVNKVLENCFILSTGEHIPISRLKYRDVREQFLQFTYERSRGRSMLP